MLLDNKGPSISLSLLGTQDTEQRQRDNQETLTLLGTQDTGQRQRGNQETLTLLGTQDTGRRQRGNQEFKKSLLLVKKISGIAPS
jgi:hypothetical protein